MAHLKPQTFISFIVVRKYCGFFFLFSGLLFLNRAGFCRGNYVWPTSEFVFLGFVVVVKYGKVDFLNLIFSFKVLLWCFFFVCYCCCCFDLDWFGQFRRFLTSWETKSLHELVTVEFFLVRYR